MTKSKLQPKAATRSRLPPNLRPLFWEHDFRRLRWSADRDLIIGRILAVGTDKSVCWLRRRVSDAELREWLAGRRGAGLSDRHLRFWELILKIPHREVNAWIAQPGRQVWEDRNRE